MKEIEMDFYCKCEKCGKDVKVDASKILNSMPAKYDYYCSCGHHGYVTVKNIRIKNVEEVTNTASTATDRTLLGTDYYQSNFTFTEVNKNCSSCAHTAVCKFKEEYKKKLSAIDTSVDSFLKVNVECIHYLAHEYKVRGIQPDNNKNSLPPVAAINECDTCPVMRNISLNGCYVGDLPCQWCKSNPYKMTCCDHTTSIKGVANTATIATPTKSKTAINENISTKNIESLLN